jgi:hypothetical protein
MVSKGDRVWLVVDPDARVRQHVGTVTKVSPAGYTHIRWDGASNVVEVFSPDTIRFGRIKVVTGEDAKPRHDWIDTVPYVNTYADNLDPHCSICNVVQSDDNEFGPCFGKVTPSC